MDFGKIKANTNLIAVTITEQTFWVGKDANVEVIVGLYSDNDSYKITSWLSGVEELNTIDYDGSIDNTAEVLAAMEKLVHDNENYIIDIASWDGE